MKDRILPHDTETEQALLSGLIINNSGFKSLGKLKADDFYNTAHQIIFKAMLGLLSTGKVVDLVTMPPYLKKTNQIKKIGGLKYLLFIADSAPMAVNVKSYSKIVKDYSTVRNTMLSCMEIIDSGYSSTDTKEYVLTAQEKIMGIETSSGKDIFYDMSALMDETITRIESVQKLEQDINLDIGMPSLRNAMFIAGSKLIIISARPGMGKTALMLSISKHLANQEIKNGILSIEMDREEISDRFLSVEADLNSLKFYVKGQFDDKGIERLAMFASDLSGLPIIVDDSKCDIEDVKRKCRKMKNEGCKIIFIDQLSKISYPSKLSEFQGYSRNCAEIAILKKELRIPIVLLCQIGRKVEERRDKRPMLSDLKQTGQIEEDADMVFFIYRKNYYDKDVDASRTEIALAKNRNGALGIEHQVTFNPKRAMFHLEVS
jgi:replicative DNA helicase